MNKRITTRIFEFRNGSIESAPEGTIVDNHITKKGFWDFYLLPLKPRQGSATPTYYHVLYDDSREKGNQVAPCDIYTLT